MVKRSFDLSNIVTLSMGTLEFPGNLLSGSVLVSGSVKPEEKEHGRGTSSFALKDLV